MVQALNHQLQVELAQKDGQTLLRAVVITTDYNAMPFFPGFQAETKREIAAELPWNRDSAVLQLEMRGQNWTVRCGETEKQLQELVKIDGRRICPEKIGCRCGIMIGMFATGGGTESDNTAAFDWFSLTSDGEIQEAAGKRKTKWN